MRSSVSAATIRFRGRDRPCELVGHVGRAQAPVYRCVMPSTGSVYLLVGEGRSISKAQYRSFVPATEVGRKAFVDLLSAECDVVHRRVRWVKRDLADGIAYLALAAVAGSEWTRLRADPKWSSASWWYDHDEVVARVKEGELHWATLHPDEDPSVEDFTNGGVRSYTRRRLSPERATVEGAPKQVARMQKRLELLAALVDKWKEAS